MYGSSRKLIRLVWGHEEGKPMLCLKYVKKITSEAQEDNNKKTLQVKLTQGPVREVAFLGSNATVAGGDAVFLILD